jgi:hypothetical protein
VYGTLDGWRAYATARGNSAPQDADNAVATAALVRGSDHVRFRYVANLLSGYDLTFTPPGYDLPLVEEAAYIAAAIELAKPGFFSRTYTASEQKVLTEVKGIKWTVVGNADGTYASVPTSSTLDAMFEPYIFDRDENGFMFMSIGPGAACG